MRSLSAPAAPQFTPQFSRLFTPLFALLFALLAAPAAASPFSVRLGVDRIILDAPPGFTDTTELASPRLQDLAATLTSASNRVLVFALSDSDVRRFTLGEQLEARRYMLVVTPRGLERERMTPAQFGTHVAESLRELGPVAAAPDLIKFLAAQPVGRANLVAEIKREPTVVSVLQATRLPPLPSGAFEAPKPQYLAFTTTLFLMQGKVLQLSVFSLLEGAADLDWLRLTTQRWQDDLIRLNR